MDCDTTSRLFCNTARRTGKNEQSLDTGILEMRAHLVNAELAVVHAHGVIDISLGHVGDRNVVAVGIAGFVPQVVYT